jgi:hypothetical protein
LSPSSRIIGPAATSAASVSSHDRASAPSTTKERSSPWASLISSITEAMEPGPASIGMAMGKTETSSISGVAMIFSTRSSRRWVRFSNTMSIAIRNSMIPPAMRKLLSSICNAPSRSFAEQRKNQQDAAAIMEARIAMLRAAAPRLPLWSGPHRSARSPADRSPRTG